MVGIENLAGECRLYHPGRRAHYIQIRVVYRRAKPQPVEVINVDGEVVTLRTGETTLRFRNHDPILIQQAIERHGGQAALRESLLCLPAGSQDLVFSLQATREPRRECSPTAPSRDVHISPQDRQC